MTRPESDFRDTASETADALDGLRNVRPENEERWTLAIDLDWPDAVIVVDNDIRRSGFRYVEVVPADDRDEVKPAAKRGTTGYYVVKHKSLVIHPPPPETHYEVIVREVNERP